MGFFLGSCDRVGFCRVGAGRSALRYNTVRTRINGPCAGRSRPKFPPLEEGEKRTKSPPPETSKAAGSTRPY